MSSFKLGDKVVLIVDSYNIRLEKESIGIIVEEEDIETMSEGYIGVDWGKNVQGHTCNRNCKDGNGWRVPAKDLKLNNLLCYPSL